MTAKLKKCAAYALSTAITLGMVTVPASEAAAESGAEESYDMSVYGGITLDELYAKDGYSAENGNIEITDYTIVSVNREEAVSSDALESYENEEKALNRESNYKISLNGTWKYNWVVRPAEKPADFFKNDYDTSQWQDITVPSNAELNGYGVPLYINKLSTMAIYNEGFGLADRQANGALMRMPEYYNPVSSYVRTIDIPENWTGRDTYIAFDGAETLHICGIGSMRTTKIADRFIMKASGQNRIWILPCIQR